MKPTLEPKMNCRDADETSTVLARSEMRRLQGPLWLRAEAGALWITLDGQTEDVVLEAGECRFFGAEASLVVYALSAQAAYRVPTSAAQRPAAARPTNRLARWLNLAWRWHAPRASALYP